jgi:N utilization substance protein B
MANRHLSRSVVLQTLFEWDFNGKNNPFAEEVLARNSVEFAPGAADFDFMKRLLLGILDKQEEIEIIIAKAAPDWPVEKISLVDRNVLRIGLFELLFSDRAEVPAKVAINESIELAKSFGGDTSGKFVNGVLGAVYKEIGEPGKEEAILNKKAEVPFENLPIEQKVGAVIYCEHENDIYFLLVHDVFGRWTLAKEDVQEGDTSEESLTKELLKETGLEVKIKEKLGETEYIAHHPEKGKRRKQITYFLAQSNFLEPKLSTNGGLDDVKWFKVKDIVDLNFYDDIVPLMTKAIHIILNTKK